MMTKTSAIYLVLAISSTRSVTPHSPNKAEAIAKGLLAHVKRKRQQPAG
jgi:hypothetical protein